jgi:O-antigen ligase
MLWNLHREFQEREQMPTTKRPMLASLLFLSPLVTSAAFRLTWFFHLLVAAALLGPYVRKTRDWRHLLRPTREVALFAGVAGYALVSAVWAVDPGAAIEKSALLFAAIVVTYAAARTIRTIDNVEQNARAFAVGVFLGAIFVLLELLTKGAITRFVVNRIDWLRPENAKHVKIFQGEIIAFKSAEFRQSAALLVFHFWPALLTLRNVTGRSWRTVFFSIIMIVAIAAPIFLSDRMSSQLALITSLIVFPFAFKWRSGTIRALAAAWCVSFVVILPTALMAYKAELHLADWVPESARARLILWEVTAEGVSKRPLFGIGAASTPAVSVPREQATQPEGFVFPRTTGKHAHNLFLQTWYELGLIGVVLVAAAGAFLALRILVLPVAAQPFAAAAFAAVLVTVFTSFSMWQGWFISAVSLTLLYLLIAAQGARDLNSG